LERLGVIVHTGDAVTNIDADGVTLANTRIDSRTVLWAAGVAASSLGKQLGEPLDRAGRVKVQADLSLENHPEIFVVGDLASVMQANGQPVPGTAPAAKQMGAHVASMIRARLSNKPANAFNYRDYGNLATIGRMAAVVDLGKLKFSGLFAWWFWLVAHLFFLIGFRNRLVVLMDWAWSYWTYQRNARIIGSDRDK
jgi:NADH dehydrogenase